MVDERIENLAAGRVVGEVDAPRVFAGQDVAQIFASMIDRSIDTEFAQQSRLVVRTRDADDVTAGEFGELHHDVAEATGRRRYRHRVARSNFADTLESDHAGNPRRNEREDLRARLADADRPRGLGDLVLAISGAQTGGRHRITGAQMRHALATGDDFTDRLDPHVERWLHVQITDAVATEILVEDGVAARIPIAHHDLSG